MEILRRQRDGHLELLFEGRLDGYWARHLATSTGEVMREGTHSVRLNLSKATYISSAGIGALVEIYKQFIAVNGSFAVVEPSRQVKHVLDMVGLAGMLSGAESAAEVGLAPELPVTRTEAGGAVFEIHHLQEGAQLTLRTLGDASLLASTAFAPEHSQGLSITNDSFALGAGAFGDSGFGEFLAVCGAAACQPTDGSNHPDYMLSSGDFVPRVSALYALACEGGFSRLARFEGVEPVALSNIVKTCLDASGARSAGMVMIAESAGLIGASLKRPPVGATGRMFAFPDIRTWISFSPESAHAHTLALIAGIASTEPHPLMRPVANGIHGHFHAAVFGYRPLQKGRLELQPAVRSLFDGGGILAVLHLLTDDRLNGRESELARGACWLAPIREPLA